MKYRRSGLIGIAVLLTLATPIIDLIAPSFVLALHGAQSEHVPEGWDAVAQGASWLALCATIASFAAAVGLYGFYRWGRGLAVIAIPISVLAYLVIGEMSYSGAAFASALFTMLCWGAVLGMSYGSSIAQRFSR